MPMYAPPHPGGALAFCFGDTVKIEYVAQKMGVSINFLQDIIDGKRNIDLETAVLLNQGIPRLSPDFWLSLQAKYDRWQDTHNRALQESIHSLAFKNS